MHLHILGICGTFMGGIAAIAQQSGHLVTGCDENIYPPMSTQLENLGIELFQGFDDSQLDQYKADVFVVGNIMTRGMPVVERLLRDRLPMISGPQWLYQHVLKNHRVVAVAGTHGKTTASSMIAWILEASNQQPGYLIGGVPGNFDVSARLAGGSTFVIEADEYDTAFFDKRSKFIHYYPEVLVLNNLEFDHADIFDTLHDIERQFHHLVKLIPDTGRLIVNTDDAHLHHVLNQGVWSGVDYFGQAMSDWRIKQTDRLSFTLEHREKFYAVKSILQGRHNQLNLTAAIAACYHLGVDIEQAVEAASRFKPPHRRLELKYRNDLISVYDDFAHHPTAIEKTIEAVKSDDRSLVVVFEPRSNSMRSGAHSEGLKSAFTKADNVLLYQCDGIDVDFGFLNDFYPQKLTIFTSTDKIIEHLHKSLVEQTDLIFMSNGGFEGIVNKYIDTINPKFS